MPRRLVLGKFLAINFIGFAHKNRYKQDSQPNLLQLFRIGLH